jgi:hypothetical protein
MMVFDSLAVGFYRGKDLIYAARVGAGLVPATSCRASHPFAVNSTVHGAIACILRPQ